MDNDSNDCSKLNTINAPVTQLNFGSNGNSAGLNSKTNKKTTKIEERKAPGNINQDFPERLISMAEFEEGKVSVLVEWKQRPTGLKPLCSWVDREILKEQHPYSVLSYYESRAILPFTKVLKKD